MKKILFALLFIAMASSQSTPFDYGGWYNGAFYVPNTTYSGNIVVVDEGTLATESLDEVDFATPVIRWAATNDFDAGFTGEKAVYLWSATQTSTLTQELGSMIEPCEGSQWYVFTYTVVVTTAFNGDGAVTITNAVASAAVDLDITTGTHTVYFYTTAAPGNFIISVLSGSDNVGEFTIDDVTLREITGGDIAVFGDILGYGTLGMVIGTTINEFSTATNLAGDSDDAVPTEKAVKAYVDAVTAALHDPVTLNVSATDGGMSLATQEISNRAATNAQTGYSTAAQVTAQETATSHISADGSSHSDVADNTLNRTLKAGISWTARAIPTDAYWNAITYGNGLFVATNYNITGNRIMTSPDGVNWTTRTTPVDNDWYGITYGNGIFVAVGKSGTGNRVMTSPDGITWTIGSSAANIEWHAVTYGNGLFVAVSQSGGTNRAMTSPDGITWTIQTTPNNDYHAVTYGNGLFVAVARSGGTDRVMKSSDGVTWTTSTTPSANNWHDVTYGNGLFVAVASNGTGRVMTSSDGITWDARTESASNAWLAITYGNGLFVALANTSSDLIMTSPDGINWTTRTTPSAMWNDIAYGNGMFVALGSGANVMTSGVQETRELRHDNIYHGGMKIYGALGLDSGTTVNEFSTDTGLAGDSDDAVPTEAAVKGYVDGKSHTDDQTIDEFSGTGNTISISLEDDGEAAQTLDISGFTAIASNTTHRGYTNNPHTTTPTHLSLVIGVNTQAHDNALDNISGLVYASPSFIKFTANDTYTVRTLVQVIEDLSLVIGTNVQAWDADLDTWAGVTPSTDGQSLVSSANYASMRGLLDLQAGTDFYSKSAEDTWRNSVSQAEMGYLNGITAWGGGLIANANAGDGRTTLGGTTIGQALFLSTNPGAVRFGRANGDNSFDWLSDADFRVAIGADAAGTDNSTTDLSEGTSTQTTVDVNSSDGSNATLVSASTSRAGLLTKAKWDEIVVNNGKTGVTGEISNLVEDGSPQLGEDLELLTYEILLDPTPDANVTASGLKTIHTNGNGGNVVFGDVCYIAADGDVEFADATDNTAMPGFVMALETIGTTASGEFLLHGYARDDGWSWTPGGLMYVTITGSTTNTLSQTAPTEPGEQVQVVGIAIQPTTIYFNPSYVLVEI